jgi:hypothetical protein
VDTPHAVLMSGYLTSFEVSFYVSDAPVFLNRSVHLNTRPRRAANEGKEVMSDEY